MAYEAKPLDILPGIFKEASKYASQGRWVDGDNVRFWKGFPERIGGNQTIAAQGSLAPPRGATAWRSLNATQFIGFGHARGVELLQGGNIYNVTPQGTSGFSTLTVSVGAITSGPYTTGETVTAVGGGTGTLVQASASSPLLVSGDNGTLDVTLTGVSGIFLTGDRVTTTGGGTGVVLVGGGGPLKIIRNTGTFSGTITGSLSGATATVGTPTSLWTGTLTGGTSGATSTISTVTETNRVESGATAAWGDGTFGSSVFGGSESLYSSVDDALTWTMTTWGEDLLACPRGGKIYVLDTSAFIAALPTVTKMTAISGAPSNALGIFMNDANRTLVAYGAHDGSVDDPLNIRWCDEEDYSVWTPTSANTAGSLRCESGSVIIGVMSARSGKLVSTDAAVFLFRYVGLPFVFSLTPIAEGCSMIGPHGSAEIDGTTFWMGRDGFYFYDGSVQPLPCDVHQYVFGRLNAVQAHKVFCETIRAYNEVWWYYVSADSTEVDSYVCYNTLEKIWSIGTKARTCTIDTSVTVAYPVGFEANGKVNAEEYGTTDNGDPLEYSLLSSDLEVDDGSVFLHNRMLIPDYDRISGTHNVSIQARGWPNRTSTTKGPYNVTSATEKISVRARGRSLRLLFEGDDDFRMGRWRFRITGHGRRE